jgi:hypothetical protein
LFSEHLFDCSLPKQIAQNNSHARTFILKVAKSDFLACFSNEEGLEAGQNTNFLCFFFFIFGGTGV